METTSLVDAWLKALDAVSTHDLGPAAATYLRSATPLSNVEGTILLAVPSEFTKIWIGSKAPGEVTTVLSETPGRKICIAITVDPSFTAGDDETGEDGPATPAYSSAQSVILAAQSSVSVSTSALTPATAAGAPVDFGGQPTRLNSEYTSDTFVIGPSNRFAYAIVLVASESPGSSFNSLFIYGDSGLDKTYPLHVTGHHTFPFYPKLKVRYANSEELTDKFISTVRLNKTDNSAIEEFRRRHCELDALLIDDIQFTGDKKQTMEGFFRTLSALYEADKRIVITSDAHLNYPSGFEERLTLHFGSDLLVDVQLLDLKTRIAILQKKATIDALEIQPEVFGFIVLRISSSIHELEGALVRVVACANFTGERIDIFFAEVMLEDHISDPDDDEITVVLIMGRCATYSDVTVGQLCSTDRSHVVVEVRQITMYLCRELTDLSLPKTGQVFGHDHATVIHANEEILTLMKEGRKTLNHVPELTNRIKREVRSD